MDFEIEKLISSQENQNTKRNTRWAFCVFENWCQEKNRSVSLEYAVPELLHKNFSTMSYSLTTRFLCDARKKEGSEYPPKSVYYLVFRLLRYLRATRDTTLPFLRLEICRFQKNS